MPTLATIDLPEAASLNDPLALRVEGWLHAGERHAELAAIEIRCTGRLLAETTILFQRPDVEQTLNLPTGTPTGFAVRASAPQLFGQPAARLECHARFRDSTTAFGTMCEILLISHDHRENHYGVLVEPNDSRLFHRNEIYTSGPSQSQCDPKCLELLRRYLGNPPVQVLDIGCGFGSYGRELRALGYDWLGVEIKASDCAELQRLGLPHVQVDGQTLPFANGSFDSTICIEVLEHIAEPTAFLREIRRVTRRRFIVSVPNVELIPYLHRYAVVPWHLLEGDHKNFFTRPSLRHLLLQHFRRVEILSYGTHPLKTPEGISLDYHLFAVCEV